MHRALPSVNKVLSKKWDNHLQEIHQKKLREMRPQIDASRPKQFTHLKNKAKKEQLQEERFTEIERENRILLEKMSSIMGTRKRGQSEKPRGKRSLNQDARKRQLIQITMENQALLKRLQEKKPSIQVAKWEREREMMENRLANICEYPYKLAVTESNKRRLSAENRGVMSSTENSFIKSRRPRKLNPLQNGARMVYKQMKVISSMIFDIEMRENKQSLVIVAKQKETGQQYTLEMANSDAKQFIGSSKDYDRIVDLLRVEDGELVLIDARGDHRGSGPQTAPYEGAYHDLDDASQDSEANHQKAASVAMNEDEDVILEKDKSSSSSSSSHKVKSKKHSSSDEEIYESVAEPVKSRSSSSDSEKKPKTPSEANRSHSKGSSRKSKSRSSDSSNKGPAKIKSRSSSSKKSENESLHEEVKEEEDYDDEIDETEERPRVIFVLGGPGSGKGTQCQLLVERHGFIHLSAGELLREEQKSGSKNGELILKCINAGEIVPARITVELLHNAMRKHGWNQQPFLIDGFPRNQENLDVWTKLSKRIDSNGLLFINASEEICLQRVLGRNQGRTDDNEETFRKRMQTYLNQTQPIVRIFREKGTVFEVSGESEPEIVYQEVKAQIGLEGGVQLAEVNEVEEEVKRKDSDESDKKSSKSSKSSRSSKKSKSSSSSKSSKKSKGSSDDQYGKFKQTLQKCSELGQLPPYELYLLAKSQYKSTRQTSESSMKTDKCFLASQTPNPLKPNKAKTVEINQPVQTQNHI